MREPVLQDKRVEHQRFCEQARLLIGRVTKTNLTDFPMDITQVRASVLGKTVKERCNKIMLKRQAFN